MKIYELLSLNKELLHKLHNLGVKTSDYKNLAIFNEYHSLKEQGEKITYIAHYLAAKHNISERQVYVIIKRFHQDIPAIILQCEVS